MSNLSLYHLAAEHAAMVARLMAAQDDEKAIADTIEAESYPIEQKCQNIGYAIRNLEATVDAIKNAERDMADRRKRLERQVERLKEYTKSNMIVAGIRRVATPHFEVAVVDNPESVDVFDARQVPSDFMRTPEPPEAMPDKSAIKAALQKGDNVPGCRLVRGQRLSVK
jgi:hypothetical protein